MNPFPIDAYAYANRLRWAHPAEKMVFAGVTVVICLRFRRAPVCLLALLWRRLEVTVLAGIPLAPSGTSSASRWASSSPA